MSDWRPFEPSRNTERWAALERFREQFKVPQPGTITSFSEETCKGIVTPDGWRPEYFHSTSFHALRKPYVGERVECHYNANGHLLAIHPVKP